MTKEYSQNWYFVIAMQQLRHGEGFRCKIPPLTMLFQSKHCILFIGLARFFSSIRMPCLLTTAEFSKQRAFHLHLTSMFFLASASKLNLYRYFSMNETSGFGKDDIYARLRKRRGLVKGCQARDFNTLIAHMTIVMLRYIFIAMG